ncbi:MAG: hypothetical protein ACTS4T_01235 [Candidatus Hodgkinia cicadicola]
MLKFVWQYFVINSIFGLTYLEGLLWVNIGLSHFRCLRLQIVISNVWVNVNVLVYFVQFQPEVKLKIVNSVPLFIAPPLRRFNIFRLNSSELILIRSN